MTGTPAKQMAVYYQDLVGTVIHDRYTLQRFIRAGGSSGVFEGSDRVMSRRVAVKLLPTTDPMMAQRFEREALTLSKLHHPNTLTVYDFGRTASGFLFMVMEYLEGHSLKELLRRESYFEPQRAVAIVSQVCRSLSDAHRHGVVHRDIKPSNIFLIDWDGNPESAKVLDFGVAKLLHIADDALEEDLTQMGRIIGTPRYMPPEQISSQPVDHRADIYSTAIVLYELLCGTVPFQESTLGALLMLHLKEDPPPFARHPIPHPVPLGLEDAVIRALEKDPADRFQTVDEFRQAIEAALEEDHADLVAGPASRGVRRGSSFGAVSPSGWAPPPLPEGVLEEEYEDDIVLAEPADEDAPTRVSLPEAYFAVPDLPLDLPVDDDDSGDGLTQIQPVGPLPGRAERPPEPEPTAIRSTETFQASGRPVAPVAQGAAQAPDRRDTGRGLPWGAIAAVLLVIGAAVAFALWPSSDAPPKERTTAAVAPPRVVAAPPPVADPPKPAPRLLVETDPPGAAVVRNGVTVGRTPMEMEYSDALATAQWTFRLEGYTSATGRADDPSIEVKDGLRRWKLTLLPEPPPEPEPVDLAEQEAAGSVPPPEPAEIEPPDPREVAAPAPKPEPKRAPKPAAKAEPAPKPVASPQPAPKPVASPRPAPKPEPAIATPAPRPAPFVKPAEPEAPAVVVTPKPTPKAKPKVELLDDEPKASPTPSVPLVDL
jgi:serine/threonine-protein kinase